MMMRMMQMMLTRGWCRDVVHLWRGQERRGVCGVVVAGESATAARNCRVVVEGGRGGGGIFGEGGWGRKTRHGVRARRQLKKSRNKTKRMKKKSSSEMRRTRTSKWTASS